MFQLEKALYLDQDGSEWVPLEIFNDRLKDPDYTTNPETY
jgi:hypothetical protein